MESKVVAVRDGMFQAHMEQGGSGDPLLYLHGSGGLEEGEHLDMLAERFTVYAPHHPGFGPTEGLDHIDDIIDMALYYHDVMDALGLESAHVVGYSLGGMLAAEIASLCSHRVRRLVLASAVGFWHDEAPVLDFMAMPPDQLLPYIFHDPESGAIQKAFTVPEGADAMMEALFKRMQSFTAAGKFLWPIPDRGLKRRIHRIKAPTLILWGESDGLVPASYAEDFKSAIPDSRVAILKEASHMLMYEQTEQFVSAIVDHLSG